MPHYFYFARCADSSLYAGYCKDLKQREATHNEGKGAKYTRARLPIEMVYSERFMSAGKALKREAEVKKWKKEKKEQLVLSKQKKKRKAKTSNKR